MPATDGDGARERNYMNENTDSASGSANGPNDAVVQPVAVENILAAAVRVASQHQ